MKKTSLKQIITLAAFLLAVGSFTSCNRGYGCPSNFSVNDTAVEMVKTVAKTIIDIKK